MTQQTPRWRAVHQFVSALHPGDGVSNSVLLVQKLLRQLGYRSEIFVYDANYQQNCEQAPDVLLLLHFSLGDPAARWVDAYPTPIGMVYHSMTPAHLLGSSGLRDLQALGLAQLAAWRRRFAPAIAVSQHNALELRALGYAHVQVAPLLVDTAALEAALAIAQLVPRPIAADYVLFVGKLVPYKGQIGLLDVLAQLHAAGRPMHLALVGVADDAQYVAAIHERAAVLGLAHCLHMPGKVSAADLAAYYHHASAYVGLSAHEGFGMPLVEAMLAQLPVLALAQAAVAQTLGGAGVLLDSEHPASIAQTIIQTLAEPRRSHTVKKQNAYMQTLSNDQLINQLKPIVEGRCDVLYAWELGAGLGHMAVFEPLAQAMQVVGCASLWATASPDAPAFCAQRGWPHQAMPQALQMAGITESPPLSYGDVLLRHGFANAQHAQARVQVWMDAMQASGARAVVADHAPTAVLAARILGLPVMLLSSGFTTPPPVHPTPAFRPWIAMEDGLLDKIDGLVLGCINDVLAHYGKSPIRSIAQLFEVAESGLATFPELDHYGLRANGAYWGTPALYGQGVQLAWPVGREVDNAQPLPKIFAYLRPETEHLQAILQVLSRGAFRTICYCPGLPETQRQAFANQALVFSDAPVDLRWASREADCAVGYASVATTTAMLLAGKPMLLLPSHMEQFMLATRALETGAAMGVMPETAPGDLEAALNALTQQPEHRLRAALFAHKYAEFDSDAVVGRMVARLRVLLH